MRSILYFLSCLLVLGCGNKTGKTVETGDTTSAASNENNLPPVSISCYLYVSGKDSYFVRLNETAGQITGQMEFRNFEKDQSKGTVKGSRQGDTIRLWYDFESEGSRSVMEIYFKQKGEDLARALGPGDVRGDTAYFKDPNDIQFGNIQLFRKTDCDSLKGNF